MEKMASTAPAPAKGTKYDSAKYRYDLIPSEATKGLAAVLTFGAFKYEANNWKLVEDAEIRYYNALARHLSRIKDYLETKDRKYLYDEETGLPETAHILTNAAFLSHLLRSDITPEMWANAVEVAKNK